MTKQQDIELIELLNEEWLLLITSMKTFQLSVEKCKLIGIKEEYTFTELESFDSLTSKFSRSSDIYTQKVLRTSWTILREGFGPFIDMMHNMEKIGVIQSSDQLLDIRDLRNKIAHEYLPNAIKKLIPDVIYFSALLDENIKTTGQFLSEHKWLNI